MAHKNLTIKPEMHANGVTTYGYAEIPPDAETFHWIGGDDGDWDNLKNWREGRIPTDGAVIVDASERRYEDTVITPPTPTGKPAPSDAATSGH